MKLHHIVIAFGLALVATSASAQIPPDLQKERSDAWDLQRKDPNGFVEGMRRYLAAIEKLSPPPSQSIAEDYTQAGHVARFRAKRPADALSFYAGGERHGDPFARMWAVDTLQFDLNDKKGALAKLAEPLPARTPDPELAKWGQRWAAAQRDFLANGRTFTGPMVPADLYGPSIVPMRMGVEIDVFDLIDQERKMFMATEGKPGPAASVMFDKLPTSAIPMLRALMYVSFLPDADAILAYLSRNDPSGYLSAAYFALVEFAQKDPEQGKMFGLGMDLSAKTDPVREAKRRFVAKTHIDFGPALR